jgi:hypothetical protein
MSVANIARITATKAPSFEKGGIVPGQSFTGDKVQANVNSGEMILNRQQQSTLFKVANGGGSDSGKLDQAIALLSSIVQQPLVVNIDGREVFNVTRGQLASGRSF